VYQWNDVIFLHTTYQQSDVLNLNYNYGGYLFKAM